MGLSTREQVRYWGIAAAVLIAFAWVMGNTLLPFIVGAAIAYLLDPLADRLETRGFSRVAATAVITVLSALLFITLLLVAVPLIVQQVQGLITAAPDLVARLRDALSIRFPDFFDEGSALRRSFAGMEDSLKSGGLTVVQTLLSSSLAVVDALLVLVLAPVIAFYLLLDWDRMIDRIDDLIPREHVGTVRRLAKESDEVLSGFVRGQLLVGVILGTFYAVSLGIIGLQFGVVVGLFAGIISFIPFVGSILGGAISIGLALFQFWGDWWMILAVAAVFGIGQAVEGNVLTPKLVGGRIRLHPVALIFALSAFGALLGFAGMLIAVPVAAVIGVMTRFLIEQYKGGRLYTGPERRDDDAPRDAAE
ncbi:AI-2E family transporter [Halovulum dunhuangense]|uniref:AI-2E family transporter n=1 Tax=Halovulum dunhuangense TaxID=1505036 RepID=A0A849L4M0_9RHOB|nr:AI-2E family transporter [Halovulum dunhuangense]NNU81203.1 AI-2E family transporter [Halovulum dunhuangense]